MVDVLVAAGPVRRMVSPHNVRVLLITNLREVPTPGSPRSSPVRIPLGLSALPPHPWSTVMPSRSVMVLHPWDEPVDVVCKECGTEGTLRFATPELGSKYSGMERGCRFRWRRRDCPDRQYS